MHRLKTVAILLGVLSVLSLAPAYAQNQPAPSGLSEKKLDQAAAAIARVNSLHARYQQKLAETPPNEQNRVVEEAKTALEKAVTDQGLSINEYNTIVKTAQNDPALREKLLQRLQTQKE